jgi:hypothetical protein
MIIVCCQRSGALHRRGGMTLLGVAVTFITLKRKKQPSKMEKKEMASH